MKAPEGLFENQVYRLFVCFTDASSEYILFRFKYVCSVDGAYVRYLACVILDAFHAKLTELKRFAEANGMENIYVIVCWYSQKLKERLKISDR